VNSAPLITGIGLVTPLGATAADTWMALLAGEHLLNHARVPLEFPPDFPRVSHLAMRAARAALEESGVGACEVDAIVLGTSKGPVERWLGAPSTLSDVGAPGDFGLSTPASDVGRTLGIAGPRLTLSAACASGLHALIRAAMLMASGRCKRVLVVAAEASVHPLFVRSFRRLGVLSPEGTGCRPFDRRREGFVMSEAAAAVLLEPPDVAARPQSAVRVDRFAMAADATHLTGSDPRGRALRHVLRHMVSERPLDLIHAHGTGTESNDPIELAAFDDAAAGWQSQPAIYSHKGALGHSLGAAGLVSIVLNVLSHRHRIIPPNVRTSEPLPAQNVRISHEPARGKISRSLAVAMGFGGPIAAVSMESS
jgi:3-oxoacyl-[acyl-carrier-protein] synthase II